MLRGSICFAMLLVSAGALAITGCEKPQAAAAPQHFAPPVTVTIAATRDVPVYLDEIGQTSARENVAVVPQVAGKIISAHFVEGTDVKKGDLLFEIDPRPFQAALDQAQAALSQAKVNESWAKTQWENVENLQSQNAISKEEYEQRHTAAESSKAAVAAAEAQVEIAKLNLAYCQVTAPCDGRLGQLLIDPGNVVKINEGTLVTIQRMDPIYADFTITESDLPSVRQNMAGGTLKTLVWTPDDTANQVAPHSGDLTFLDNAVISRSGTVKLRATIPNHDRHFWPGEFVNIRLVLRTAKDAVLIPNQATQISQKGPFVYVVDDQSKAQLRPIQLGQMQGDEIVVTNGLHAGDRVVVTGQLTVVPDSQVTVMPAAAMPTTGQSAMPSTAPSNAAPTTAPGGTAPATQPAEANEAGQAHRAGENS